jgi:hypothetical protein
MELYEENLHKLNTQCRQITEVLKQVILEDSVNSPHFIVFIVPFTISLVCTAHGEMLLAAIILFSLVG